MPAYPIVDHCAHVTYSPHVDEESGAVGFRAQCPDGVERFIMLNPSGGSDDGVPTVFLYQGRTGSPSQDEAVVHVVTDDCA